MIISSLICMLLMVLFFMINKKEFWSNNFSSTFECGFSSHILSRNSFSIQYFFIGLLFLLLELEFCLLLPFFMQNISSSKMFIYFFILLLMIFLILIYEWINKSLEWKI